MRKPVRSVLIVLAAAAISLDIALVMYGDVLRGGGPDGADRSTSTAHGDQTPSTYSITVYMPLTIQNFPLRTIFGIEMGDISTSGGLTNVVNANASLLRRNALLWSSVETAEGARNWTNVASLEQEMINASASNLQLILVVRSTPGWAQLSSGVACGRIQPAKLGAFSSFVHDAVARYSAPPYNVHYWEIWNEPDVDPATGVTGNSAFGCWGDGTDPDYGGKYYAQMLQAVYPQIKSADPTSQVLIGGLLLDCNPNLAGACTDSKPPRYLQGILAAGGGPYFDGVGFHAYDFWDGSLGRYSNPNWHSSSASTDPRWPVADTGPALIAKARFVKDQLNAAGVTGKFLMNTESGLVCWQCPSGPAAFETTKTHYVAEVYAATIAEGLRGNIWYSYDGWFQSGLSSNGTLLPAYTAYQFAATKLGSATYSADVIEYAGVKGYKFNGAKGNIWLVWSIDGTQHSITLPQTPAAVWDALGAPVSASGNSLAVTVAPLYVELP